MDGIKWSVPLSVFGEPTPPEDQNDSIFGDMWTGIKEGATTDVAHTVTGLADLAGSVVGADTSLTALADEAGLKELSESRFRELTPETQRALQEVESADGFWGTTRAYLENPRAIAYEASRALPTMFVGAGVGAKAAKGLAGLSNATALKTGAKLEMVGKPSAKLANTGAAIGEGTVGAGMSSASIAQYNAENPETRAPLEGVGFGALTGLGTGVIAGAAGRYGGSIESALFNKGVRDTMTNSPWASVGKSAVTEGIEEAAQSPTETIPQNWAEDKPWDEGLGQGIAQGMFTGAAMGGGAHGAMRALRFASPGDGRPQVSQEPVDVNQAASGATMSMEGATPVEGVIQQGDQVVPTQIVASAKAAPTQMVPVGETPPATLDAEEAKAAKEAEKLAAKQARENERLAKAEQKRQVKAEIAQRKADEKKAKEDEFQQARARYLDIFGVPEDQRERYKKPVALDAVRKHYDKEGYAPAAKALREANEALGSRDFDNVNKLVPALNGISENATTSAEFADRFDGLAKQYAKSNPKKAEVYTLAAQAMRSPDKSMADVFDAHQRKQAFDRFEAANQAAPKNLPTYDLYDVQAGNLKPGKAQLKFTLRDQEITFQGQVKGKQFFPDAKQLNDYADYIEGKRERHPEFYDSIMQAINPADQASGAVAKGTDPEAEISENALASGEPSTVSELVQSKADSTEEPDKQLEAAGIHVTSDIGGSKTTDEHKDANNFIGRLMYTRLLTKASNRGADGKRIVELDTKHKTFLDGSLAQLEEGVKNNPALAKEFQDAITSQEALDAVSRLEKWKPQRAANAALELLVWLDKASRAANFDPKKADKLSEKLFNLVARGQQAPETNLSGLGIIGPNVRPTKAGMQGIKAQTPAGERIQKESFFVVMPESDVNGVAVQLKTIAKHTKTPEQDLKGLFTDEFIARVVPVLRDFQEKGYPINDEMWLVDGSHPIMTINQNGTRVPTTISSYGMFVPFNDSYSAYTYNYGLGGVFFKDFKKGDSLLFCAYTNDGKATEFFKEHTVTHELIHSMAHEVGDENVNRVWHKASLDLDVNAELDRLKGVVFQNKINEVLPDYKLKEGELDGLKSHLSYPEWISQKKREIAIADGASAREATERELRVYCEESAATYGSLSRTSSLFKALLATGQFPKLEQVIEDTNNVILGTSTSNIRRVSANNGGQLPRSGDGPQPVVRPENESRVERRIPQQNESVAGSQPRQTVGSGSNDRGRPEEGRATPSRESGQGQGLTQRTQKAIDAAIDKAFKRSPKWKARAKNVNHFLFRTALGGYFTRDVIKMAYDATGIDGFRHWGNVHEKINTLRNELLKDASAISNKAANLPKDQRDVVNEYIKDAVVQGAWGYWHKGVFKDEAAYNEYRDGLEDQAKYDAEIAMRRRWVKLNKAQREVISDVFEYGNKQLRERYRLLKEKLDEQRMPALEEQDGEIPENAQLEELRKEVDRLSKSPYVPLMRAGSHMVIFKSADYVAAEKELKAQEDVFNSLEKPTKEDRKRVQKAASALNALKSSGDDYAVEFVDGYGTAEQIAKEYESEYPGSKVVFGERLEELKDNVPGYKQLERAANMLAKSMEEGELADKYGAHAKSLAKELHAMISKMYIESLAETSAKKRMLKKRTVRGFNQNMIENLMAAAPSTANMLAFMRYSDEVAKAGREIDESIKKLQGDDFATARVFQSELIQRENLSTQQTSDAVNGVLRTASMMMLLTNPAYYLQNMTQSIMMSAPFMAQRHGAQIFKRLVSNTMEVAKWMKDDPTLEKLEKQMLDESVKNKPLSMDEWKALDHSRRHGHLDIGMTQDFGDVNRGGGKVRDMAVRVSDKLNKMARQVEMLNRVSTFLTAYRAEIMRGQSPAKAREYADEVIYQTHGDYSAFNAPKWFTYNGLTRVMTQFRKFQLIQAGLMTRLAANSFKGATPEVRAEARRQFAYMLATHMAFTGLKGTPFATVLLGIAAMGMGDTGDDGEDLIRKMIGDKDMSNLLMRGVPAWLGMDVSGKIGAENMLSPMPYMNAKFSDGRDGANELIAGALGPAASLVQKFYTAGQYFVQGDEWKALEYALPNGLATNLSKGVRFMTEGYSSKAGDVLVKPQDYDVGDFLIQTLGFQPRVMTDRMRVQDSLIRHKESFDAEKNRIYMDFKKARREGDHAGMNQARREMLKLAAEARKQGLTGYTIQNMINAANDQRRRERQAVGGVGTNKNDRQFVKKMSEV